LKELYLDGCEKINDLAIIALTSKAKYPKDPPPYSGLDPQMVKDYSTAEEMNRALKRIGKGGTRGLEVLSLSECRNIYDAGVVQ